MTPVWKQTYDEAIVPYTSRQITLDDAWAKGIAPIRRFMSEQIERTEKLRGRLALLPISTAARCRAQNLRRCTACRIAAGVHTQRLKTAFLIGFQIYLPFLVLDIVVASVTISMGMMMLPPVLISLPFKLLLFVLVDGWHLVVEMLLESFQPFT